MSDLRFIASDSGFAMEWLCCRRLLDALARSSGVRRNSMVGDPPQIIVKLLFTDATLTEHIEAIIGRRTIIWRHISTQNFM